MEVQEFAGRCAARLIAKWLGIVPQRGAQEVGLRAAATLGLRVK